MPFPFRNRDTDKRWRWFSESAIEKPHMEQSDFPASETLPQILQHGDDHPTTGLHFRATLSGTRTWQCILSSTLFSEITPLHPSLQSRLLQFVI